VVDALTLLSGDAQTFFEKVWASQVSLHHAEPADLVGLLSLEDVDHLLTGTALRTPALRVAKDGGVVPSSHYTRGATMSGTAVTGLVDARSALSLFEDGATLILQGLHRYWPALTELVRDLELALGHPCQANAYLTPPRSQGFSRHSDTHDVFVFQTHGRKQWQVVEHDEERDVLLEPGLSMYLPTGTPHSARSQDDVSLHVTVGINQLTWRSLLRSLAADALADERYDAPLPAGYLDDPARLAGPLAEALTEYAGALSRLEAPTVAGEQVSSFLRERAPVLRGGLTDLVALDRLTDAAVLRRRSTAACVLREDGEVLVVLLGDRELRMPRRLTAVMEFVRDQDSFRLQELAPWLDPQSRLVVARRLVREGLLRIAG